MIGDVVIYYQTMGEKRDLVNVPKCVLAHEGRIEEVSKTLWAEFLETRKIQNAHRRKMARLALFEKFSYPEECVENLDEQLLIALSGYLIVGGLDPYDYQNLRPKDFRKAMNGIWRAFFRIFRSIEADHMPLLVNLLPYSGSRADIILGGQGDLRGFFEAKILDLYLSSRKETEEVFPELVRYQSLKCPSTKPEVHEPDWLKGLRNKKRRNERFLRSIFKDLTTGHPPKVLRKPRTQKRRSRAA